MAVSFEVSDCNRYNFLCFQGKASQKDGGGTHVICRLLM